MPVTVGQLIDKLSKIDRDKVLIITNMTDSFNEEDFDLASDQDDLDYIDIIMDNYAEEPPEDD